MTHKPECWKNQAYQGLGIGGDLASCTCGLEDETESKGNWKGKAIEEYTKEELIEMVFQLAKEIKRSHERHINVLDILTHFKR